MSSIFESDMDEVPVSIVRNGVTVVVGTAQLIYRGDYVYAEMWLKTDDVHDVQQLFVNGITGVV